jgi:hypothetical protein
MEDLIQSSYDRKNKAPLWWYNKASDLHASAGALWLIIKGDNEKSILELGFSSGFSMPVACSSVYEMLFGMSLELILKSIFVVSQLDVPFTHNLVSLAEKLDIKLSQNEIQIFQLLTDSIVWDGRYPVPKKQDSFEDYHNRVSEVLFTPQKITAKKTALVPNSKLNWENLNPVWNRLSDHFFDIYDKSNSKGT